MKPSNFTLNSDYLSIAQVGTHTYDVYVGGGSLTSPDGYTEQNFDFTTPTQNGSVDRILIKKDNDDYVLCSYMTLYPNSTNVAGFILVYRTSSTNLRAKLVLENRSAGVATYPSMTFRIKVSSFKPPNIF